MSAEPVEKDFNYDIAIAKADDPADNIGELAKAVADLLSVEVEIDDITVEASASVSVS